MLRILLIRHATTELISQVLCGRTPGVSLNEKGYREAMVLAKDLKTEVLSSIVSSPLERAVQTATAIADGRNVDVQLDPGFNELDFGLWTGKRFDELQEDRAWRDYNIIRSLTSAPGGETLISVQARAWLSLSSICNSRGEGTVAVVTHGDVIRALLVLLLGMPLDNIVRIEIAPASVSEVIFAGSIPKVSCLNRRLPE